MIEAPKYPFGREPMKPTPAKAPWDKEKKDVTN